MPKIVVLMDDGQLVGIDCDDALELNFKQEPMVRGQQGTRTILSPGPRDFTITGSLVGYRPLNNIKMAVRFLGNL